jgi:hypothetical protein
VKISFPKPAEDYFNQKADELLLLLRPAPTGHEAAKGPEAPKRTLSSSHVPSVKITDKDFHRLGKSGTIDGFGNQTSKFFPTEKGPVGLDHPDYRESEKLVDRIVSRSATRSCLSTKFVLETLFDWFEHRYKGSLVSSESFVGYLLARAEEEIKERKIAIPIAHLVIERPFTVGKVTFDFYTSDYFDHLEKVLLEKNPQADPRMLRQIQEKYQGVVFATVATSAEPTRATEIATDETERTLALLRFFSPTIFYPQIASYFGRMGHAQVPVSHYFVFDDEIPRVTTQVASKGEFKFVVDATMLHMMEAGGLFALGEILIKDNHSEFEELLLTSITLFAKSVTSNDFQDRLVFALASMETMLLSNSSEPIQYSVGIRLAFVASQTLPDRKSILELIRRAYAIRSSYIHHGKRTENLELLTRLLRTFWSGFHAIILNRDKFATQAQFLDFVENMILS